jgi:hypothetical protein
MRFFPRQLQDSLPIALSVAVLLASLLLVSCGSRQPAGTPTSQPQAVLTTAAQTAEAQLTLNAAPPPSATPTQTRTFLPLPTTAAPTVTGTPLIGFTPSPGTPAPGGTDLAEYVADVTIPDATQFRPGESFTKTWRLKNSGTTTWTTDYALTFFGGAQLSAPTAVQLPSSVLPGNTIDVSVEMVAPQGAGNYRGFWKMRNAAGSQFDFAVYVDINVVGGTPGNPLATGTPGPSPTPGPGGSGKVSEVSLVVDDASASDCPHTFAFTASFHLSETSSVTYVLEAGSSTPGFVFDLPGPQTGNFGAGSHSLTYTLEISNAMSGWAQFRITSPSAVTSSQVAITVTCAP